MADTPTIELDEADFTAEPTDVNQDTAAQQDTATEESSTKENNQPEVAEPSQDAPSDADSTDAPASDEEEDSSDEEPSKGEEQPRGAAEERKVQLSGEIRDLVSQRNDLRQQVEQLNAQVYAPQSVDDIMSETGQSQAEARITAMEQRQELSDYNNRVAESQLVISSESERVLRDFPMFDPNSEQFAPEVASSAASLLAKNLLTDPNTGQIIGSNVSPYELYQTIASAHQAAAQAAQIQGQRNTEQMLASAEPQSSAVPKTPKEDHFLSGLKGDKYN